VVYKSKPVVNKPKFAINRTNKNSCSGRNSNFPNRNYGWKNAIAKQINATTYGVDIGSNEFITIYIAGRNIKVLATNNEIDY
jgi:hypothetical protein